MSAGPDSGASLRVVLCSGVWAGGLLIHASGCEWPKVKDPDERPPLFGLSPHCAALLNALNRGYR